MRQFLSRFSKPTLFTIIIGSMLSVIDAVSAAEMRAVTIDRGTYLVVSGRFVDGDFEKFKYALNTSSPSLIVFESPGGSLEEGLAIGSTIAAKKLNTLVSKDTLCASACAIAWLGGNKRFLDPTARLGFHAAYIKVGEYALESGVGNALVGAYLANLGLGYNAVRYITTPPPSDIQWLSFKDAIAYGISVNSTEETQLNTKVTGQFIEIGSPNYETARRAMRAVDTQMQEYGMFGLAAGVQECFKKFSQSKTLTDLQFCYTYDLITSEFERFGRERLGVREMNHLAPSQVLNRTNEILHNFGVSQRDKQYLLDNWTEMAYRAWGDFYRENTTKNNTAQSVPEWCNKASTDIEKYICSDSDLARLEIQYLSEYKRASSIDRGRASSIGRENTNQKNKCNLNKTCLSSQYSSAIAALGSIK